jgi:predicted GNAT family N-acyltransferase
MSADPVVREITGSAEWEAALALRVAVFVDEQGGPLTDEPDAWDPLARHWIVLEEDRIVGTARVYEPYAGTAKIGRVAICEAVRGRGYGKTLMKALVDWCREQGFAEVILDAQEYAIPFYERLGFAAEGEPFMDAGIPHRRMRLGGVG